MPLAATSLSSIQRLAARIALPLALLLWASSAHAWTDITTSALADTGTTIDKKGVAFIDFDGDGDLDICCVGEGSRAIRLLRNDGVVGFVDVTAQSGALLRAGSGSAQTWGDYDNDGDVDLFVTYEETRPALYRNDGNGHFTDVTAGPMLAAAHGHSTSWADYDRDGDLDVYAANLNQPSKLFRNDGGTFVDATVDSLGCVAGEGVGWADYDNDGDPDLYAARFAAQSFMFRNEGGVFTDASTYPLNEAVNAHSCSWADYDNDGDLDLYVCNANLPNVLLRNEGGGAFTRQTPPALMIGDHSVGMSWGDYDNDGDLDLFVAVTDGRSSHLLRNDGGGVFTDITESPLFGTGFQAGVANGDFDGDGDLDLYVGSYSRKPNLLLRNDLANGNHWIELDLQGRESNRTAIGARVEVYTGGNRQIREVSGCTGFRSQNALTVHVGLGAATVIDSIHVRWPNGFRQDTLAIPADHRFAMTEGIGPTGVGPARPTADFALAAVPQPVRAEARVSFVLATASNATLAVHDPAGRLVRTLVNGSAAPGLNQLTWTGTDDGGNRLAPGMYFLQLSTPAGSASRRVLLLDP